MEISAKSCSTQTVVAECLICSIIATYSSASAMWGKQNTNTHFVKIKSQKAV